MRTRSRVLLFAVVFVALAAWVQASGGAHAMPVRHFLHELLRRLF